MAHRKSTLTLAQAAVTTTPGASFSCSDLTAVYRADNRVSEAHARPVSVFQGVPASVFRVALVLQKAPCHLPLEEARRALLGHSGMTPTNSSSCVQGMESATVTVGNAEPTCRPRGGPAARSPGRPRGGPAARSPGTLPFCSLCCHLILGVLCETCPHLPLRVQVTLQTPSAPASSARREAACGQRTPLDVRGQYTGACWDPSCAGPESTRALRSLPGEKLNRKPQNTEAHGEVPDPGVGRVCHGGLNPSPQEVKRESSKAEGLGSLPLLVFTRTSVTEFRTHLGNSGWSHLETLLQKKISQADSGYQDTLCHPWAPFSPRWCPHNAAVSRPGYQYLSRVQSDLCLWNGDGGEQQRLHTSPDLLTESNPRSWHLNSLQRQVTACGRRKEGRRQGSVISDSE
ncbi:hypothetical protein TREES_T100021819 [Tupaia chinensis]|uniref:Uncharacterized protein n=1 Tax=Tupaia chinensis TaxID=246437 RepID=L9JDM0_TUPCH|nr:hypothetical protein TREES_T100021819 [Tupaia chinensis]